MELHVTGFNAHKQLRADTTDDVTQFFRSFVAEQVKLLGSFWSCSVIQVDGEIYHMGYRRLGLDTCVIRGLEPLDISSLFGDVSGLLGALTRGGRLFRAEEFAEGLDGGLRLLECDVGYSVDHVVVLHTGEVCALNDASTKARRSSAEETENEPHQPNLDFDEKLHSYRNLQDFLDKKPPLKSFDLSQPLAQLCGSAATFTALSMTGEVLTWGTALHAATLGRKPDESHPDSEPCLVDFLGGIKIRKIASGDWITAALSHDKDLYVWGGWPVDDDKIECLPSPTTEDLVALVDIDDGIDILDIGVGSKHIVVLTVKGDIWATGDNTYGQLGLTDTRFYPNWEKVDITTHPGTSQLLGVGCGTWSSWFETQVPPEFLEAFPESLET